MARSIMNLGPVNLTRHQDYRQLSFSLLLSLVTAVGVVWGAINGFLFQLQEAVGLGFSIAFGVLLVAGLLQGVRECFELSRGLNHLKQTQLDERAAKALFNLEDFRQVKLEFLQEEVGDNLYERMDRIKYLANVSVSVGLCGTVYGIAIALGVFAKVRGQETFLQNMPIILEHLSLAFYTTLVGIVIMLILNQMYRFVRSAATLLKNRIFRALHATNPPGSI